MKIGHKLSLGFVGLTLLIAALGYIAIHISQTALQNAIGESSVSIATQTLDNIHRTISNRVENIQVHATNPIMQEVASQSNAFFENLPDPNKHIKEIEATWNDKTNENHPLLTQLRANELTQRLKTLRSTYNSKHRHQHNTPNCKGHIFMLSPPKKLIKYRTIIKVR